MGKSTKKRIALWGAGIFQTSDSKGIPSFSRLLERLSDHYDIRVYSHRPLSPKDAPSNIKVTAICTRLGKYFDSALLTIIFFWHHFIYGTDILQGHSSYPDPLITVLIGRVLRKPTVIGFNAGEFVSFDDIGFGALLDKKLKRHNTYVVNHASVVTAVSQFHASSIEPFMRDTRRLKVVYRGVDLSSFEYCDHKPKGSMNVAMVGYLHPVKDQITGLKAFGLIRQRWPCKLHIVGRDIWSSTVQNKVNELGLVNDVVFYDSISHAEMPKFYQEMDLMLHTPRYDAIGAVVAEAFACGVLVCGTRVGLLADLSGQCCLVSNVGDAEELAEILGRLLSNVSLQASMRSNGRAWVMTHDLDWAVNTYSKIYDDLVR